jgi:ComF family protein
MAVNLAKIAKVYIWSLFNLSGQPCCLCGQSASVRTGLCPGCQADLPVLSGPLCRCALPLPASASEPCCEHDELAPLCGRCLHQPPPFLGIQAPLIYAHPVDRMLNDWKHRRRLWLDRPLQHLLRSGLTTLPQIDLVVPVPLHWRRQWRRGFNQAARLADGLARQHRLPLRDLLRRPRAPMHQQGSSARARRQLLRDSFVSRQPLQGQRILLVDDVITTGSTARAASQALLDAGADSVSVVALCRVLPPELVSPAR